MIKIYYKSSGELFANGEFLVDIRRPFHKLIDKMVSRRHWKGKTLTSFYEFLTGVLITPHESINTINLHRYAISLNDIYYCTLFKSWAHNCKTHGLYMTEKGKSKGFRIAAFEHIANSIHQNTTQYNQLRTDLEAVIKIVLSSYDFDCIVTDIPVLKQMDFELPIIHANWNLHQIVEAENAEYFELIKMILQRYEEIPLRSLVWKALNYVDLPRDTSFKRSEIAGFKKVLVLILSNKYYAGFLCKEIFKLGIDQVLPVTIFLCPGKDDS